MKKLFSVFLCLSIVACSSSTIISTNDKDAKILVDGQHYGQGTVTYMDTKIIGSTTMVQIKKEGCEDRTYVMSRSEQFQVGPCIGGVFVLVPFLWVMGYNPQHHFDFECQKR